MNDVSNRAVREFSEFLDSVEKNFPKPISSTAYEITMKSTIVSALITLDTEKKMDERFWNHLRVQRNILDFLYTLWLDDDRTLVDAFSTIIKDLVEYDFSIAEEQLKERLNRPLREARYGLSARGKGRRHRRGFAPYARRGFPLQACHALVFGFNPADSYTSSTLSNAISLELALKSGAVYLLGHALVRVHTARAVEPSSSNSVMVTFLL